MKFRSSLNSEWPVFAAYQVISAACFGFPAVRDPGTGHVGFTSDPAMMMWFLAWWPYALWHRVNPFITRVLWPPAGYNLMWATSMPAVSAAFAPVTALFGVVAAYNLAALVAPALSALAAYFLCRGVGADRKGSFLGGLIYGFSPYEVGHVLGGHLVLSVNFIPPLCVLFVVWRVCGRISAPRFCALLSIALIGQFLIDPEIFATITVFGLSGLLCGMLLLPAARQRLFITVVWIAGAYCVAAVFLIPFLYFAFIAGRPPATPIFPASFFSANLLGFVVPGRLIMVHPFGAEEIAARFNGNLWENGAYFGLPLLLTLAVCWWREESRSRSRLELTLFLVVITAALGPRLQVGSRSLGVMPWKVAANLPLLEHALPVRFINYAFLVAGVVAARLMSGPRFLFRGVLAGAIILTLFPNPAFLLSRSRYETPRFFAANLYRRYLNPGENVLIIPFGRSGPSMAWQAASWMYFRMPGGHLSTMPESFIRWPVVNTLLTSVPIADAAPQFRAFLQALQVDDVLVTDAATGVAARLPGSLGVAPEHVGGVRLYRLSGHYPPQPLRLAQLQTAAALDWFGWMLCTARRFLDHNGAPADLSPANAYRRGLLPASRWSDNLELLLAGLPHGASNGLWIGLGPEGTLQIGVPASGAAARRIIADYKAAAVAISYPYPTPYSSAIPADDTVRFLLMTLRPQAFLKCPVQPDSSNLFTLFND